MVESIIADQPPILMHISPCLRYLMVVTAVGVCKILSYLLGDRGKTAPKIKVQCQALGVQASSKFPNDYCSLPGLINNLQLQWHMPRLLTSLILKAYNKSPLLTLLLRPCRDLPSARNELRWLREHAIAHARTQTKPTGWRTFLRRLCEERGRGKPLQYILGNQPFGDVDILCRSGVLIPRCVSSPSSAVGGVSRNGRICDEHT